MLERYNANGILQPKLALEEPTLRVLVGLVEDIKNISKFWLQVSQINITGYELNMNILSIPRIINNVKM